MAERYGYRLEKSKRRSPAADDSGLYAILDVETRGTVHAAAPFSIYVLTLTEAETLLDDEALASDAKSFRS